MNALGFSGQSPPNADPASNAINPDSRLSLPIGKLREARHHLRNGRGLTRREFAIGDRVRVILERVDASERRLQFALFEQAPPKPGRRSSTTKSRPPRRSGKRTA